VDCGKHLSFSPVFLAVAFFDVFFSYFAVPATLIRTACKIYISLVSLSAAAPLPAVNNVCSVERLVAPYLLSAVLLMSNFNVSTAAGVGRGHQRKMNFLHEGEYFACGD